jgi:Fe-S-cluster-containing dehydrogenase component
MHRKAILVDIDSCYGCFACEVACKQEHNLPIDIHYIRVHKIGPKKVDGRLRMDFHPMQCRHCARPPCIEACPENAITQRTDGIVLISEELCIGCLKCIEACPFGAIECHPETGLAGKCDLCVDRIDQGELPSCVYHCPTEALQFGDPNEITARKQKMVATEELGMRG